ncbi:MAG TPA: DUF4214 domain-containing protein, partial [Pyrinomonadaceae bacterium]|nr:DUF4214 domain-containing protein [Pyrinomonadaceae bacterium]
TVDGVSTTVLRFPTNNGLALSPTTGVILNDVYTIVTLLKFDEANKRRRILDFKNGSSDNGLYAEADNNLRFAAVASGSGGPMSANTYIQVAITRDAAGLVTGYVNGAQQFQFNDGGSLAVTDTNNTLRFFQDNTSGGGTGEASAGMVARLRLYARALSAAEIAGLDREPSGVKFSAANYNVSEGAGSATVTVTRTGFTSLLATVGYTTSDETARQSLDYMATSGTLSFAPGETSKTFQVPIINNQIVDLDRQLTLFLQNPNGVVLEEQSVALLTITDNETGPPTWQGVVLATNEAEIKTWTTGGRTYAYLKLLYPNAGYRVTDFGQAVQSGNDFTANATVEKYNGPSVQAVTSTAGIYDLGTLAPGSYNFTWKNTGTTVKTQAFTVAAPPFPANTIDDARQFVKQQYRDFLNREADPAGEDFWTDNITKCNDPARRPAGQTVEQCTLRQRETTSGAFFLSPEFQYTGYYVLRLYTGALSRQPKLSEFLPDAQFVGNGIVVNGALSAAQINQNKAALAAQFVNCTDPARYRCAEFKAIYDSLNNQLYVDRLFLNTGVNASASDRTALVNGLNGGTETRATVLQKVVDGVLVVGEGNQQFTTTYGQAFYNAQFTQAFVQLEYFGYMKRDPDEAGYAFWLGKLNQFGGDFVAAEMVLAFISSPEYRARFGQP